VRKRLDPLWGILGEKVYLKGVAPPQTTSCPQCHVLVELPRQPMRGERFRCGLCGALCEVIEAPGETGLIASEISDSA
jgi:hypothetical protein